MLVKAKDNEIEKYPYSTGMLRLENPKTSFPTNIPLEMLARYDVYKVVVSPVPDVPAGKIAEKEPQPKLVDGVWTIGWTIRDMTEEEIGNLAVKVRNDRNRLLIQSDWTQVSDAPVDQVAWASYRQELRDLTKQQGFPVNISWPSKPE